MKSTAISEKGQKSIKSTAFLTQRLKTHNSKSSGFYQPNIAFRHLVITSVLVAFQSPFFIYPPNKAQYDKVHVSVMVHSQSQRETLLPTWVFLLLGQYICHGVLLDPEGSIVLNRSYYEQVNTYVMMDYQSVCRSVRNTIRTR